jgi:hypothetical protein
LHNEFEEVAEDWRISGIRAGQKFLGPAAAMGCLSAGHEGIDAEAFMMVRASDVAGAWQQCTAEEYILVLRA